MMRRHGDALAHFDRNLVHRPLALGEDVHDLGAAAAAERGRNRRERIEQRPLRRRTLTHTIKLMFE